MLGKRGRDEREEDDDYDAPEGAGPTTAPEELLKAVPEEAPDPAASKVQPRARPAVPRNQFL